MTAPRADILVPTCGQEEFTVRCFDSLLEHTEDYRLVWIDNGSPASSRAAVLPAFARHRRRLSIFPGRNLGFVGGTNLGLRSILGEFASKASYVVMLNNDTEVTSQWLDRLTRPLDLDPSLAATGPMTSPSSSWQAWPNVFRDWGVEGGEALAGVAPAEVSRALANRFGETIVPVAMLAFFCTAFRSSLFAEVGLLDPSFGAGLGDDDDYCLRIRRAGYGLGFVPSAYVVHHHRTTFRSIYSDVEIDRMQRENLSRFHRKHNLG
jgi:GT2 family glycosyltransferase